MNIGRGREEAMEGWRQVPRRGLHGEAAENIRKEPNTRTETRKSKIHRQVLGGIKGQHPRWVPDDELENVKAIVPGYVEQEEDPIQRGIQDMKDKRQSEGIRSGNG